ncbi:Clustered mitochondria protein-like [Pseudocercospora fuligena]|uniref:Clustered mitochondria protein-like n=1 Tax=Pseudocercospora fuligena TaxID=685502 RepID=A0A8H6VQT4_9PEZI|nr:Clustered mitochondria protein-like [Pseudocercospora fuligena]
MSNANGALTNGTSDNASKEHDGEDEDGSGAVADNVFQLTIKLPHAPGQTQIMVSSQEQVQDIRQSIVETPHTFQYSCFHLEHQGKRINDFVELSEVAGIVEDPTCQLVEDPYTEAQARMHVVRVSLCDSVEIPAASNDRDPSPVADYDLDAPAPIATLLARTRDPAPKTIKSIALSSWNPPPYHLRMRGHLIYLQVVTNEGEQFYITSHVSGFYVNRSTNHKFDPAPRSQPKSASAHSLINLLSQISPSFEESFKQLQEYNGQRDPLASYALSNSIPAAPWLVAPSSIHQHQSDLTRTQEAFLLSGAENADTLRDWNEEFQSTRELPKETVQDRVFRERLTSKLFAEYNEAAVRGACLVARGEVQPLNPTEAKDAQIFVYNNVFYSFGADGVGTFASDGGDEAARIATGKDVQGVKASIVPGIFKQREPGEHQIDYGGVEGKDVIATHEEFAQPFSELSKAMRVKKHAVWDKEGKKHELEASVETKGLMGTMAGNTIMKMREYISNQLEQKRSEREQAAAGASEDKTQESGKTEEPEANGELVAQEDSSKPQQQQEAVDMSGFSFSLNPDVFSGQLPQTDEEKEEWAQDEIQVRAVGEYLTADVIPRLVRDLQEGDVGFPMDGHSLVREMHRCGVNVRYIGDVARLASEKSDKRLQALTQLCHQEMVSRAFKHISNGYLRVLPPCFMQSAVAHLLNCLLGTQLNAKPQPDVDEDLKALYQEVSFDYEKETPEGLSASIRRQILSRYRYELQDELVPHGRELQALREVSKKLGLQLEAKDYVFTKEGVAASTHLAEKKSFDSLAESQANGTHSTGSKKNKKKNKQAENSPNRQASSPVGAPLTFRADDILNIVPLVKEASPKSILAEEALDAGRMSIQQDQKELGQELLLESLSLHEQIYGILHPEVARVYYALSTLYYSLDEKSAAVELAKKAVIVSERTLGIDDAETILAYLNLSLFEHATGNTRGALAYVRHALNLWKIVYGTRHPDSITTINNAAVMLQSLKQFHESRLWFEASLTICEEVAGKQSINTATLLFQLAQALALDQDSKQAVSRMRESYSIFKSELGPDNQNTKEAENWLVTLTHNAVSQAKQASLMQNRRILLRNGRTSRVQMGTRPQPPVGQSEVVQPSTPVRSRAGVDQRNVDELIKYINGEGSSKQTTPKKQQANPKRRQQKA